MVSVRRAGFNLLGNSETENLLLLVTGNLDRVLIKEELKFKLATPHFWTKLYAVVCCSHYND